MPEWIDSRCPYWSKHRRTARRGQFAARLPRTGTLCPDVKNLELDAPGAGSSVAIARLLWRPRPQERTARTIVIMI